MELHTNPPSGARIETSVARRHVTLHLCDHDKASLLVVDGCGRISRHGRETAEVPGGRVPDKVGSMYGNLLMSVQAQE